ncbi:ATP-binding cassette domain-containing protein [Nocardioides sp. cx-169]|uniref:ATP-binding cassette domain-containing protein n=1 Tax=Nocardioides sp. cx-169 TaxID=2899080 RepID=UPI001E50A235|nr:ATP-binding cassette domain-containing protein [Nocardioides sp. cx-169]MCD4536552.1 ATP-binding cassette domain-containing protein [Nocardioides sp. cx-169]
MITVESLTRRYAGFAAVDHISFTALPGRVTGFLGPNGAGKSTTMRVMVGLTAPTSGSATIDVLSSHLLHEIEVIADDLVVIGNGKILAAGTKAELLAAAGTFARSTSPRDLAHALERAGIASALAGDGSVRADADPARVGTVALTAGIALTELRSAEGTGLEDMFLSLTADTQREGVTA